MRKFALTALACCALLVFVATLLAVAREGTGTKEAGATKPYADLKGEILSGKVEGQEDQSQPFCAFQNLSMTGKARGPYPGTFTQTVTVLRPNDKQFQATFAIDSPSKKAKVSGQMNDTADGSASDNHCEPGRWTTQKPVNGVWNVEFHIPYTAKVLTSSGELVCEVSGRAQIVGSGHIVRSTSSPPSIHGTFNEVILDTTACPAQDRKVTR